MNSIRCNGKKECPSKVVCVGRNYVEHALELGNEVPDEVVIFMKPNSAIAEDIVVRGAEVIHFEGEITLLIGDGGIKGVGFGLDLTKREVQSRLKSGGLPWERAKAFDGSAVVGDFVEFQGNPDALRLELYINGSLRQSGGCDMMLFKPGDILKEIQSFLTLEDGDLIMTGTPEGVGPIKPGDEFAGKIFEGENLLVENSWRVQEG